MQLLQHARMHFSSARFLSLFALYLIESDLRILVIPKT